MVILNVPYEPGTGRTAVNKAYVEVKNEPPVLSVIHNMLGYTQWYGAKES
jgi:hypothetical protein